MTTLSEQHWFTEVFADHGTAFSLQIEAHEHSEDSEFQKIDIYRTRHFGRLMVLDGCVMLTSRDNFLYHEMMTHPALFTHRNPQRVVIIGGGDCGALHEVLKHPTVQECWQVEIDERVTRLSEAFFPELCQSNNSPRARFFFGDGIRWIQQVDPGSIDVIIIDSTDPVGPAAGLFAADFYRDCLLALAEGGLLVQQTESPLLHGDSIIRKVHQDLKTAGFSHSHTLPFPQPVYPSGWWSCTMAGKGRPLNAFREADFEKADLSTRYYNPGIHRGALCTPAFLLEAIGPV